MEFEPFGYEFLSLLGQIAFEHLERTDIEQSDVLVVNGMDMGGFVFLRLEEHLNDDSVESDYFGHIIR